MSISLDPRKNLNKQATKVLQDIVLAYETGVFDDPHSSAMYCSLLACICEGKVQGFVDEKTGKVKWSLTPQYSKTLDEMRETYLEKDLASGRVVHGPWS